MNTPERKRNRVFLWLLGNGAAWTENQVPETDLTFFLVSLCEIILSSEFKLLAVIPGFCLRKCYLIIFSKLAYSARKANVCPTNLKETGAQARAYRGQALGL